MTRLRATVQRPTQSDRQHEQDTYNCRARPTCHCLGRPSEACVYIGNDSAPHRQPTSAAPHSSSKTARTDPASKNHALRAHCTLPGSFHHLSSFLRGGVMWGHPHISASPSIHLSPAQSVFSLAVLPFSGPQLAVVIKQGTPAR